MIGLAELENEKRSALEMEKGRKKKEVEREMGENMRIWRR